MTSQLHTFLRLFLVLWLALAPSLAAVHEHDYEHGDESTEHVCVLCQLAERADDALRPSDCSFTVPRLVGEDAFELAAFGEAVLWTATNNRGPPLSV